MNVLFLELNQLEIFNSFTEGKSEPATVGRTPAPHYRIRVSYDYINIHTVTYGFTAFFSQGWQLLKEGFVPGGEMRNLSRDEF